MPQDSHFTYIYQIKKLVFLFFFMICLIANAQTEIKENKVLNDPGIEEWISLFNGKDLSGWDIKIADYKLNENYKETFVVRDSMIRIKYDNYTEFNDAFGHLYYKTPYSYYKISFDYRFVGEQLKGGASWNVRNSGIMLHSQSAESNEIGQGFPVSVELQLLGGLNKGKRTTGNVCTPGTSVVMNNLLDHRHCISSASKTYHGDQWVHVEALVLGGESMEFIIEGETVLSFKNPQIGGGFTSLNDKGKDWDKFKITRDKESWISRAGEILTEGYIALQAESHPIDFKNIQLLDLCGCMDLKAKNYKSYFVKDDPSKCQY